MMWPSTQRIGKGVRCNFLRLTYHDELSALDLSMIAVVLKPSWWVWILTVMPVWLYFSSFLFCSVSFLNTKLCILRRDQLVISTHDIDTLSNWKVTRTQGYLIKYQILHVKIISNVWETMSRIDNYIRDKRIPWNQSELLLTNSMKVTLGWKQIKFLQLS